MRKGMFALAAVGLLATSSMAACGGDDPESGGSGNTGGIITREAPIHVSNVQLVVGSGGDAEVTRVGYERREVTKRRPDGSEYSATRSVRIARKTGKEI